MNLVTWILVSLCGHSLSEYIRGCYYTSWSQHRILFEHFPEDIDVSLCTHLYFAFANLSNNRLEDFEWKDFNTPDRLYERFTSLKMQKSELRTILSVGEPDEGTNEMTKMLSTEANRNEFIKTSVQFLRQRNFDGLDFHFPGTKAILPDDKRRFTLLLEELRKTFDGEGASSPSFSKLLLVATVSSKKEIIDAGYEIPKMNLLLDLINLMTYDFHGSWDSTTGHSSPLYSSDMLNLDWGIAYWINGGADPTKLIVGMPGYGMCFKLQNPQESGIGTPVVGACQAGNSTKETRTEGCLAYFEICKLLQDPYAKVIWSEEQQIPYVVIGDIWVGFDNEKSFKVKVDYIKKHGLGGWFYWETSLDDFKGTHCGGERFPLLKALNKDISPERPVDKQNETDIISMATEFDCRGKPDGRYKHPNDCHSYFNCSYKVAKSLSCPEEQYFNDIKLVCTETEDLTHERRQECQLLTTEEPLKTITSTTDIYDPITTTSTTIPSLLECHGKPDGQYKHPNDCHSYIECSDELAKVVSCPDGQYFNDMQSLCSTIEELTLEIKQKCHLLLIEPPSESTTPTIDIYDDTTTTFPSNPLEFVCHGEQVGRYKHPRNCHLYIKCSYELARVSSCPDNLYFNDQQKFCSTIEELTIERRKECFLQIIEESRATTTSTVDIYDETSASFPANSLESLCRGKPDGRYRHPRNCHFYIKCSYKGARIASCQDDLLFNELQMLCTTIEELTVERRKECHLLITEEPNQITTPTIDIYDDASTTSTHLFKFDCRGKPNGRYKHPRDCHFYVMCSYEVAKLRRCPGEQIFDNITKSCSSQSD